RRLREQLPEGFSLLSCEPLGPAQPALNQSIRGIEYRVELPDEAGDVPARLASYAQQAEASVVREREGKTPVTIDLKRSVDNLVATGPNALRFTLKAGENEAVARPSELLSALFGAEWTRPGVATLIRESVVFGAPATRS
ncbi:MAG TPA: DUF2344 domain-containing protein, partial [Myxococcales bacterium]|nr:DUF2344 domain-containing protein [Myxococcales bacterium]